MHQYAVTYHCGKDWGEEMVRASDTRIWLEGKISPGPDYRLYLTPSLATDEASFLKI